MIDVINAGSPDTKPVHVLDQTVVTSVFPAPALGIKKWIALRRAKNQTCMGVGSL